MHDLLMSVQHVYLLPTPALTSAPSCIFQRHIAASLYAKSADCNCTATHAGISLELLRVGMPVQMHKLIKEHKLEGDFRWLVAQNNAVRNGEIYRFIAGVCWAVCLSHAVISESSIALSSDGPDLRCKLFHTA